jgi:hypothetical protein
MNDGVDHFSAFVDDDAVGGFDVVVAVVVLVFVVEVAVLVAVVVLLVAAVPVGCYFCSFSAGVLEQVKTVSRSLLSLL